MNCGTEKRPEKRWRHSERGGFMSTLCAWKIIKQLYVSFKVRAGVCSSVIWFML